MRPWTSWVPAVRHEPCGDGSGTRLAGSALLSQPPEDDLPRGALCHLAAIALAQARHKCALGVSRMSVLWGELLLPRKRGRRVSGGWLDLVSF